jgi:hypothetical protein
MIKLFILFIRSFVIGFFGAVIVLGAASLVGLRSASAQTTSAACGGTSQPRCQVYAPVDQATTDLTKAHTDNISAWNEYSKSQIYTLAPSQFSWTFIPRIPTATCSNPSIEAPNHGVSVTMDVCGPFNTFGGFINGVLAFLCVLGCVQQVRSALAA